MNENMLKNYIKDALQAGLSYEQIARALTDAGWRMADILPVLSSVQEQPMSAAPNFAALAQPFAVLADNITKSFGDVKALKEVSIQMPYGKVFGLLGPNGAGKTTLVRILTTLLKADRGVASVAGYDVQRDADQVRTIVGLTGQFAAIDDYLTGRENLELVGKLYHLKKSVIKARAWELLEKFGLTDAADRSAKTYSGGMKRRLDLAMSLFNSPKVLFLDEPTTGLDPQSRIALWQIIKELVAEGTTVLLTTQYLEEADNLAETIVVINHGQVIASGTPNELKSKIGGDVLEIHFRSPADTKKAAQILSHLAKDPTSIEIEPELGKLNIPTLQGSTAVVEAVRALDKEQISIADIMLRRPTLDDVFLTLTGGHIEGATPQQVFAKAKY
jgi:ABC-2 type transport system ATP-binding protein